MYATTHAGTRAFDTRPAAHESPVHTAVLATAAVIVGSFLIGLLMVASVMLSSPLPASDGAAPLPQMLPQPTATGGLDA